jgi:hypothetical protein
MATVLRTVPVRRRSAVVLWSTVLILLGASALSGGLGFHPPLSPGSAPDTSHPALSQQLRDHPVPFLPVHVRPIGVSVPATVNPLDGYSSEPAPMGIGDFGVGEGGKPYTYNTTEFLGNFSWQSLSIDNNGNTYFSDQLNVVLQFVQAGVTYAYWIQDVAFMDSSSRELTFENNIWNFTTNNYCLDNSALSGNGTVYAISGCEGYYAVGASGLGSDEIMPVSGDFSLLVRSYLSGSGLPEVAFEYWDGVTSYDVTYDNVVWPWATAVSVDNGFVVDGNNTAPSGNFYDAELSIGGPGGGSSTVADPTTDIGSRLLYWNGNNLEAPRSVWNFGADTAETISNVQSFFSHDPDGTPHTTQLNGTTRNATPARAYDQGRVGTLSISVPSISSGTVSVNGTPWSFRNDQVSLTLVPGVYPVWVNSSSLHNDLGACAVLAEQTTTASVPGECPPAVSTPTATPGGIDLGQSVVFRTTVLGQGSGGDSLNWSSLASALNCTGSTSDSISCRPTATGTYPISVTITDSDLRSTTSGTLEFSVDSDPTVGTPSATPSTVETGLRVSFLASASGGSGVYSYSWTNLPSPCTGTASASPICHPASIGVYSVSVSVTDSHSYQVTSGMLDFTVTAGPSVSTPVSTPAGPIDVGEGTNFSTTASGGTPPYTYSWQNLPDGCPSRDLPTVSCLPNGSGTYYVAVSITDSVGGTVTSGSVTFAVDSAVSIGSVSASPSTIDLGKNTTLTAVGTSGGSGIYTYSWSGLPSGCTSTNSSAITCAPSVAGAASPKVGVHDTLGGRAAAGTSLLVVPDPSIASVVASRPSVDLGQNVNYSAHGVAGGVGALRYAWTNLPTGCASTNSPMLTCTPTGNGTFDIAVTVTDSEQVSSSLSLQYTVYPLPVVATPTLSSGSPAVGQTFHLTSSTEGGSGDNGYTWTGLPPGCASANSSSLVCTPTTSGTYNVAVTVRDANGGSTTSNVLSFVVAPRPAATPSSWPLYLAIAGGVGVVALAAALIAISRRRKRAPPAGPP